MGSGGCLIVDQDGSIWDGRLSCRINYGSFQGSDLRLHMCSEEDTQYEKMVFQRNALKDVMNGQQAKIWPNV